jgi:hypothetical protein
MRRAGRPVSLKGVGLAWGQQRQQGLSASLPRRVEGRAGRPVSFKGVRLAYGQRCAVSSKVLVSCRCS